MIGARWKSREAGKAPPRPDGLRVLGLRLRRCGRLRESIERVLLARHCHTRGVAARRTEIPIGQLQRGAQLALNSARRLALAASAAVDAEDPHTAAVLLYQAAEEVGKAKLLSDHADARTPLATSELRDHNEKFRLALRCVPADCLELWGPAFDPMAFEADAFQTEPIRVDWGRRQAALYANWDEERGDWLDPAPPETRVVRGSAARMADFIDHVKTAGFPRR